MKVALTGGIASGKTFCLNHFRTLGAETIDADALAGEVVQPGTPALEAVVQRFGRPMRAPDGSLNRATLGRLVFADASARRDLEAIVHPAVYARIEAWFAGLAARGAPNPPGAMAPIGIAEIPLLYETRREKDFDAVVVAACDRAAQIARLATRFRTSPQEARARLDAQWPLEEKRRRADYAIDTSGTEADTRAGVERVWDALSRRTAAGTRQA